MATRSKVTEQNFQKLEKAAGQPLQSLHALRGTTQSAEWVEHAQRSAETEVDVKVLELASRALQNVEEARNRAKNGLYGICTCGKKIPTARLTAIPEAVRCIDCEQESSQ